MEEDFDVIATTLNPEPSSSVTLKLYDIFIPLLGVFIILLNSLVVISSGLLLKKRKLFYFRLTVSIWFSEAPFKLVVPKTVYR